MDAWRFSIDQRTWERLEDPPESLFRSTLVRFGDEALVFGGTSGGGEENDRLWKWGLSDGSWTAMEGAPGGRYKAAAEVVGEDVWMLHGGRTDDSGEEQTLSDAWLHSPQSGIWDEVTPAEDPGPRTRHALAWDGEATLWLQGGIDDDNTRHEDVWSFDLDTRTWTGVPASGEGPGVRASHSMVFFDGDLIVWGGRGDDDTVWAFDTLDHSWRRLAEGGPAGRDAQVTDLHDGLLYIMGGDPSDDETLPSFVNDVWVLDIADGTWEELWAIE